MKTILPWIVTVLAIGGALLLFNSNKSKSVELAKLQAEVQEMETLRAEVAELKSQQVPAAEVAQLRKDKEDLLRLRNEVGQLRNEKQQLTKQAQAAAVSAQNAQAEVQRVQEQAQAQAQAQAAGVVQAQQQQQQVAVLNACINNLRQLDAAKQQWALENQKTADAIPTAQDIAPYLKGGVIPVCPATGKYTLNAVGVVPTCSIAGHALPQQ